MIVRGLKIQAVNSGLKMTVENYWGRQSNSNGEWRGEEFCKPRSGSQEKTLKLERPVESFTEGISSEKNPKDCPG